jgi:hydrogenase assembly chaperone HypC/HupF
MCIGVPLQVEQTESEGNYALCRDGGASERLDMRLVGELPAGTWVLAFHGAARRVLDPAEAGQIRAALQALGQVLQGDAQGVDALFADLLDREPQLPEHLRTAAPAVTLHASIPAPNRAPAAAVAPPIASEGLAP